MRRKLLRSSLTSVSTFSRYSGSFLYLRFRATCSAPTAIRAPPIPAYMEESSTSVTDSPSSTAPSIIQKMLKISFLLL